MRISFTGAANETKPPAHSASDYALSLKYRPIRLGYAGLRQVLRSYVLRVMAYAGGAPAMSPVPHRLRAARGAAPEKSIFSDGRQPTVPQPSARSGTGGSASPQLAQRLQPHRRHFATISYRAGGDARIDPVGAPCATTIGLTRSPAAPRLERATGNRAAPTTCHHQRRRPRCPRRSSRRHRP